MWLADLDHWTETVFPDRPAFAALVALHDLLKPTPLFRVGSWLFICMVVCGFAWRRRHRPEAAFAFGMSVFYIGYLAFEVPSNLILARMGARRWLARIMITWGLVTCCMMTVGGPWAFCR